MIFSILHIVAADSTPSINFLDYLSRAGVITFLILVVYGGYKKWWVWGWQYAEKEKQNDALMEEKDAWRETALRGANVATQAFEEFGRRKP